MKHGLLYEYTVVKLYTELNFRGSLEREIDDILTFETYTWLSDAWKKKPVPQAIEVSELSPFDQGTAQEIAERTNTSIEDVVRILAKRDNMVDLAVNGKHAVIERTVADKIVRVLKKHSNR